MLSSSIRCPLSRTLNRSEIEDVLQKNSLKISSTYGILIGSRAARYWLPNFRRTSNDNDTDWDIICSSQFLLNWLQKNDAKVNHIEMIIPISNANDLLDLYIYCTLVDTSNYDFVIPRSSTSYTTYLLDNLETWTVETYVNKFLGKEKKSIQNGSAKLLLILKKFMLYYKHQWIKTAKDYRQLLTIADQLTDNDTILCDLFIQYNEKIHGTRLSDTDQFVVHLSDTQKDTISIRRDEFLHENKDKQLSVAYQIAWSMAINDDILVGLEYICTQAPLWNGEKRIQVFV
ncbi:unnamed protein product [Rotaria sp. Silwood1]|nr:unnamed protein product [Rotaria sp. Silwood1]CAF1412633.1 unnamed protein product [Rotaria sp. Silwood1]